MGRIFQYLIDAGAVGADSAVSSAKLRRKFDLGRRELFAAVQRERAEGCPICAALAGGYFIPATNEELHETTARLRLRADSMNRTADAMEGEQ